MPCYDPPPPYQGEQRKNAEEAVKLLCDLVTQKVSKSEPVSVELLTWWKDHRAIDAKAASYKDYDEVLLALLDVEIARELLRKMK